MSFLQAEIVEMTAGSGFDDPYLCLFADIVHHIDFD